MGSLESDMTEPNRRVTRDAKRMRMRNEELGRSKEVGNIVSVP